MKQRSILAIFVSISILIAACSKSDTKPDPVIHPPGDTIVKIKPDTTEDIYVVGSMGMQWGYWKNSQFVALTGSGSKNYTSDMAFSGKDIYVAGSIGDSIGYWKNNQFNFLTKSDSLMPVSITILGRSDVYVSVYSRLKGDVNYCSRYYKKGVPVNYTGISGGFGSRIFVRPR